MTKPIIVETYKPAATKARKSAAHTGEPKVSICIPAFQAERHLRATIDSALAQTYANLEIVVVDNNSSDGTAEILGTVNDHRVRVIRNDTTVPMMDNFNLAIWQSSGEFVKLVCADDLMEPECVAAQAAVLQRFPDVSLVSARTDFIDDDGKLIRRARGLPGIKGRCDGQRVATQIVRCGTNPIGPPVAAMFRRRDFNLCGEWGTDLPFLSELDVWVRLLRYGSFYGVPSTLASFRISGGSLTGSTSASSQLAQQIEFARRLGGDPRWVITKPDRIWGRVKCYDMQLRRTALYSISTLRNSISTLRESRQCRDISASVATGNRLPNSLALKWSGETSGLSLQPERGDFVGN
jgi:glycosyltransferase involved in cell wall biosynthesis